MADLFDMNARAQRRDRAFRSGPVMFLYERVFVEILDRLADVSRDFSSAMLIGTPDPSWPERLAARVGRVTALDPGSQFAAAAGGVSVQEDALDLEPASFDLCVAIGTLDTVNDLPGALLRLRFLLKPDSPMIGVIPGGETLPRLRQAMRAADSVAGAASPHVHPRIEPASLAQLLTEAGFEMPVVDVERVQVAYRSFRQLLADLRGMGMTNVLNARPRTPVSRAAFAAAEREFERDKSDSRTTEVIELVHFAAWTPPQDASRKRG